jgi:hypothetical protein
LTPTSVGDSKFGELRNLILAVTLSEKTRENKAESEPELIVMVDDSLTVIVAALPEIAVFSAKEKVVALVKVGAVVSYMYLIKTIPDPPAPVVPPSQHPVPPPPPPLFTVPDVPVLFPVTAPPPPPNPPVPGV